MRYTAAEHDAFARNFNRDSLVVLQNFALCDVGDDNGPFETTVGTHRMNKADAMAGLASGAIAQHRYKMKMGDVMIRDVRAVHRGTPNSTDQPRPMVVLATAPSPTETPSATWTRFDWTFRHLPRPGLTQL